MAEDKYLYIKELNGILLETVYKILELDSENKVILLQNINNNQVDWVYLDNIISEILT